MHIKANSEFELIAVAEAAVNNNIIYGLIVSEDFRKSSPNATIFFFQNFSLNSTAYIYLLVKFLFCLFLCFFFHVYLLPVMVNKDVYSSHRHYHDKR